jgi:hypothetical protein
MKPFGTGSTRFEYHVDKPAKKSSTIDFN